MNGEMKTIDCIPQYPDVKTYVRLDYDLDHEFVWEADNWQDTCMSWKKSCYIHAGISGACFTVSGPDALALVAMSCINSVSKWKVGKCKHLVMLDEDGYITNHGLTKRMSEDSFKMFAADPTVWYTLLETGKYNATIDMDEMFIFQMAGPLALTAVEKAAQQDLHSIKFLETMPIRFPGVDVDLEFCRIGMSGTIGFEVRGPKEYGPQIYDMIYQAGKEYGMKRLGWRAYAVNHLEGGFPQMGCSFLQSSYFTPEYKASGMPQPVLTGSYDPDDIHARMRTPGELDWLWMSKFDHEFIGRAALEAEAANPKRKIVNLLWNSEDVVDIYASLLRKGDSYKYMEMPCAPSQTGFAGGNSDIVQTTAGKVVGISSSTVYSYYYREVLSQCVIDIDQAELGNEVIVQWGDFGGKIKNVRATVVRYPYLDLVRNEDYDLSTIPYGYTASKE